MISPTAHRSASVVFGHGLLPGLRPVRLRFGYAAERGRVDRKRIQDKDCFVITTRPPKRGRSKQSFVILAVSRCYGIAQQPVADV
jgi:hypothetical protein